MSDDAQADLKQHAAEAALGFVQPGMTVGLGTGSTARFATIELGRRVRQEGWTLHGVPSSEATAELARQAGIPLTTLDEHPELDVTIDGADEVDPEFRLIKGAGGALVREKVLAAASRQLVIVVDGGKLVMRLGQRMPVPVEVVPFAAAPVQRRLTRMGAAVSLRRGAAGENYRTDNGNWILDCHFGPIADPAGLEQTLRLIPGVLDCGLFIGLAHVILVADQQGVRRLARQTS